MVNIVYKNARLGLDSYSNCNSTNDPSILCDHRELDETITLSTSGGAVNVRTHGTVYITGLNEDKTRWYACIENVLYMPDSGKKLIVSLNYIIEKMDCAVDMTQRTVRNSMGLYMDIEVNGGLYDCMCCVLYRYEVDALWPDRKAQSNLLKYVPTAPELEQHWSRSHNAMGQENARGVSTVQLIDSKCWYISEQQEKELTLQFGPIYLEVYFEEKEKMPVDKKEKMEMTSIFILMRFWWCYRSTRKCY